MVRNILRPLYRGKVDGVDGRRFLAENSFKTAHFQTVQTVHYSAGETPLCVSSVTRRIVQQQTESVAGDPVAADCRRRRPAYQNTDNSWVYSGPKRK